MGSGHTSDDHIKHGKARHLCITRTDAKFVGHGVPQPQLVVEWHDMMSCSMQVGEHSNGQNHGVYVG